MISEAKQIKLFVLRGLLVDWFVMTKTNAAAVWHPPFSLLAFKVIKPIENSHRLVLKEKVETSLSRVNSSRRIEQNILAKTTISQNRRYLWDSRNSDYFWGETNRTRFGLLWAHNSNYSNGSLPYSPDYFNYHIFCVDLQSYQCRNTCGSSRNVCYCRAVWPVLRRRLFYIVFKK